MLKRTFVAFTFIAALAASAVAAESSNVSGCCMKAAGVERTVANVENGVRVTLTGKDPSTVAELQRRSEACPKEGCADCPMHAEGVSRTVEKAETGIVITATSTDPAMVAKLQQHAASAGACPHKTEKMDSGGCKKHRAAQGACKHGQADPDA